MMLQLNPPIPVETPRGKGMAQMVIDYGPEHHLLWVVFQSDGQCWSWQNPQVRGETNLSYNRVTPKEQDSM